MSLPNYFHIEIKLTQGKTSLFSVVFRCMIGYSFMFLLMSKALCVELFENKFSKGRSK